MGFPQKLQEYRQTAKLSQEALASLLGVSRQSVSKWEQGLSFPETEKLIELSSMMGVTIDSLLKDTADPPEAPPVDDQTVQPESPPPSAGEPEMPARESSGRKRWVNWLATGLILLLTAVAIWQVSREPAPAMDWTIQHAESTPEPETTLPTQTETEPVPTETEPAETEPGFDTETLQELQRWFFDFAVDYRLDYMPQFTQEDGPTKDAGEYLYWAYAINLDHWGEDKGQMSREYVEETALMYFSVIVEQHRSHLKSWDYDANTETYTAYPTSLENLTYYLLNSVEVSEGDYTVHATRYTSPYRTESLDDNLILALTEGVNTELIPISEVTVTFCLDHTFHRPVFKAFAEELLPDTVS